MTTKYRDLLAQRAALEEQIAKAREEGRGNALATIRELMQDFEITVEDIVGKRTRKTIATPVTAKYRDPDSGKTWSGRGKPPAWIAGKDRDAFLIK
jgi:DNA-binding protein H-NS